MRTAMIFGATGLVGAALLDRLLGEPRYDKVVVVGRRPTGRAHERLAEVIVELDRLDTALEKLSADDVYVALGTTIKKAGSKAAFRRVDYDFVVGAAKAAARQGAQRLAVVSSIGAAERSLVFYSRVKGEMEAAVRALPYASVHLFRPSFLGGSRSETRAGEKVGIAAMGLMKPLMLGPLEKFRVISGADVAEAMVRVCGEDRPGVHVYESDEIQRLAHLAKVGVQQRPS